MALNVIFYTAYGLQTGLMYHFTYDKRLLKHAKFKKDQIFTEIKVSLDTMWRCNIPRCAFIVLQVQGHSLLYDGGVDSFYSLVYLVFSCILFVVITDLWIFSAHKLLHTPWFYKYHKEHHASIIPTPFCANRFHWVDGCMQSLIQDIFPFFVPINSSAYLNCKPDWSDFFPVPSF